MVSLVPAYLYTQKALYSVTKNRKPAIGAVGEIEFSEPHFFMYFASNEVVVF